MQAKSEEEVLRQALAELVAVKDLKRRVEALEFGGLLTVERQAEYDAGRKDYLRRQPAAWDAARAALAMQASAPAPLEAVPQPMTKAWCVAYPASAAYIINNLAHRVDAATSTKPAPTAAGSEAVEARQIAMALRPFGLTLLKTADGYDVQRLGTIEAQGTTFIEPVVLAHRINFRDGSCPSDWANGRTSVGAEGWLRRDKRAFVEYAHDIPAATPQVELTEDEWLDLAETHANADWNSEKPDGYLNSIKAVCAGFLAARGKP